MTSVQWSLILRLFTNQLEQIFQFKILYLFSSVLLGVAVMQCDRRLVDFLMNDGPCTYQSIGIDYSYLQWYIWC